jgi:hypothetical protein
VTSQSPPQSHAATGSLDARRQLEVALGAPLVLAQAVEHTVVSGLACGGQLDVAVAARAGPEVWPLEPIVGRVDLGQQAGDAGTDGGGRQRREPVAAVHERASQGAALDVAQARLWNEGIGHGRLLTIKS